MYGEETLIKVYFLMFIEKEYEGMFIYILHIIRSKMYQLSQFNIYMCIFDIYKYLKLFKLIASNFDCCRHWQVGKWFLVRRFWRMKNISKFGQDPKEVGKTYGIFFGTLANERHTLIKIIPVESQVNYC